MNIEPATPTTTVFVVHVRNNGTPFWLRGTNWAFHRDRATEFKSREEAQAAIFRAQKFWHHTIRRAATIIEE